MAHLCLHLVNPCWLVLFLPNVQPDCATVLGLAVLLSESIFSGKQFFSCLFGVTTSLVHQMTYLRVECSKDTICACTTYFNKMSSIMHCQNLFYSPHYHFPRRTQGYCPIPSLYLSYDDICSQLFCILYKK